jgi:hypothetical protein
VIDHNKFVQASMTADVLSAWPDGRPRAVPVFVVFRYDAEDPFAVSLAFRASTGWVQWIFARDLLSDAIGWGTAGEGDVQFDAHPDQPGQLLMTVASPSGHAVLAFRLADLAFALARTEVLVPWDAERIDWDLEQYYLEQGVS